MQNAMPNKGFKGSLSPKRGLDNAVVARLRGGPRPRALNSFKPGGPKALQGKAMPKPAFKPPMKAAKPKGLSY